MNNQQIKQHGIETALIQAQIEMAELPNMELLFHFTYQYQWRK